MENKSNYERFPNNVFEPKLSLDDYQIYLARFNDLYDLYNYLNSDPRINYEIFSELSSVDGGYSFAGKPYEEALKDLIKNDLEDEYEDFVKLEKTLENCINIPIHKYKTIKTLAGGHLNVPAYSSGNPLCYETEERIVKPKFAKINVLLSYTCGTTKKQVFNRALIIINILKTLENAGYSIDLNTFSLAVEYDEYIHIIVNLKKYGERLNNMSLYKSLCHVEFLRRIIFRVRETMDVKNGGWLDSYGRTCDYSECKKVLKFGKNDIFFDQPVNMGIDGENLYEDFINAIEYLDLGNMIDVEGAKNKIKKFIK